jgi:Flp pilus assembly protein TadG
MTTPTHTRRFNLAGERGQSMVEFAVILPILVMLFLAIWQFGVAFHHYLAITDAARVGARAAAVKRTNDPCGAARTAIQNTVSATQWGVISSRITCSAGANTGDPVTIGITFPYTLRVFFDRSITMNTTARERLE